MSKTAPSAARKAAQQARLAAAGAPASTRGRKRRKIVDAANYVLSVRLTPDEEKAAKTAANAAGLSLADWTRKAITGTPIMKQVVKEVPSTVDAEFARMLSAIGNNANQLTRAWNKVLPMILKGNLSTSDTATLRKAGEDLSTLIAPLIAANKGTASRLLSAAKLAIGVHEGKTR